MRGSHFENRACGRGQEGGKARSQLQSVGWLGRLDSWAGWNGGEGAFLSFSIKAQGLPFSPLASPWALFSRWLHLYEAGQGSQKHKSKICQGF